VIEDEVTIADFIERGLRADGYVVDVAMDGATGLALARDTEIDLVVLDRLLPLLDGLAVLRGIRAAKPAVPVIMLTARAGIADRVEGLDAGASDYLVKPFAFAELAARVRAHLRGQSDQPPTTLQFDGITLDLLAREASRDGSPVRLSTKEFELLAYLMRRPDVVHSRERILADVWGYEHDPETNVVDVYVSYLRRKLATATGRPAPIVTIRSVGYRMIAGA
jgi:DNA-binding response OmpR family regulator